MIKDILVHLPTDRAIKPVIDASVSLASFFDAHIEAFAAGDITANTYAIEGSSAAAVAAVFEIGQQRATDRAMAALTVFETEARTAGISYHCRPIVDLPEEAAASISAASRLCDLSVVLQPEPGQHAFDSTIPTKILLQSGGPVLFVPYIFRGKLRPRRIGVCWDGSRLAARALRDAEPLLAKAESFAVISANSERVASSDAAPEQVVKRLKRYGRPVKLLSYQQNRPEIQPSILSLAADENVDMLVMGAYGHSQFRESVLGGVTREMLESMTVPTLMSH